MSPTKAAAGGGCQTAGIKMRSGDRGMALQHAGLWSRSSPLHWHSGINSISASLPKHFSGASNRTISESISETLPHFMSS